MKKHKNICAVCVVIVCAFFAAFTARLVDWQLVEADRYRETACASGAAKESSEPVRGEIYDKNGNGLVVNRTRY